MGIIASATGVGFRQVVSPQFAHVLGHPEAGS
jgi:hypothetical protein